MIINVEYLFKEEKEEALNEDYYYFETFVYF